MSYRDGHFQDLKVPLTWTVGVAVVVAAVAAGALLLSDRRETLESGVVGVARATADVAASPVGQAVSAPGRWTSQAVQYVRDYFGAVSENRRLRAENAELRQWKATAIALDDTNARYREHFRDWVMNWHTIYHRPSDRIVSFKAYWVSRPTQQPFLRRREPPRQQQFFEGGANQPSVSSDATPAPSSSTAPRPMSLRRLPLPSKP